MNHFWHMSALGILVASPATARAFENASGFRHWSASGILTASPSTARAFGNAFGFQPLGHGGSANGCDVAVWAVYARAVGGILKRRISDDQPHEFTTSVDVVWVDTPVPQPTSPESWPQRRLRQPATHHAKSPRLRQQQQRLQTMTVKSSPM